MPTISAGDIVFASPVVPVVMLYSSSKDGTDDLGAVQSVLEKSRTARRLPPSDKTLDNTEQRVFGWPP